MSRRTRRTTAGHYLSALAKPPALFLRLPPSRQTRPLCPSTTIRTPRTMRKSRMKSTIPLSHQMKLRTIRGPRGKAKTKEGKRQKRAKQSGYACLRLQGFSWRANPRPSYVVAPQSHADVGHRPKHLHTGCQLHLCRRGHRRIKSYRRRRSRRYILMMHSSDTSSIDSNRTIDCQFHHSMLALLPPVRWASRRHCLPLLHEIRATNGKRRFREAGKVEVTLIFLPSCHAARRRPSRLQRDRSCKYPRLF